MALDKKQIVHFKRMLKEAQKKERFFAYIQEGEDGEPVLLMDKKMSMVNKEGREARKKARKKVMVVGEIKAINSREWAFIAPDPKKGKLPRSLKMVFGKDVPQLKKCQCLTPDEYAELTSSAETRDTPDSESSKGGSDPAKTMEKSIHKATAQLDADPSQLNDADLKKLKKQIDEYQAAGGGTDYTATLAQIKKTRSLRKGAVAIEKKLSVSKEMRQDVLKRFQAIQGTDDGALDKQKAIIGEVKTHIEELKKLRAKYQKAAAS